MTELNKKMYSEEVVKEKTLEFFKGNKLATKVWMDKYALKSDEFFYESSPIDMFKRITDELKRTEDKYPNPMTYDEINELINDFKYFIPGGSVLFGIGNPYSLTSLGNCFVIYEDTDSYGTICYIDQALVQLMKRRGGVGTTIENYRPKLSKVNNAARTSTGGVSYMHRFSNSTREVAQDGRRGALMLACHISYINIVDFIESKDDLTKITGANISVKVTDEFLNAVESNGDFLLRWPVETSGEILPTYQYNKINNREDGSVCMKVKAKDIWKKIIKQAHKNAEPGVLFWDNIIKESPADCYASEGFKTVSTNPCLSGDSLILTNRGQLSIKYIVENFKDLKDNLEVLTYNEIKQSLEYKKINDAFLTKRLANLIELELEDGSKIKLTPDHKVFTKNRGWIKAAQLNRTDILLNI